MHMESSRRAAHLGLGAAVLLLLACVTLLVASSVRADAGSSDASQSSNVPAMAR